MPLFLLRPAGSQFEISQKNKDESGYYKDEQFSRVHEHSCAIKLKNESVI